MLGDSRLLGGGICKYVSDIFTPKNWERWSHFDSYVSNVRSLDPLVSYVHLSCYWEVFFEPRHHSPVPRQVCICIIGRLGGSVGNPKLPRASCLVDVVEIRHASQSKDTWGRQCRVIFADKESKRQSKSKWIDGCGIFLMNLDCYINHTYDS